MTERLTRSLLTRLDHLRRRREQGSAMLENVAYIAVIFALLAVVTTAINYQQDDMSNVFKSFLANFVSEPATGGDPVPGPTNT
ncbi:MAG: hypothetical protein ACRCZD_01840 [Phycicoccus sp.]